MLLYNLSHMMVKSPQLVILIHVVYYTKIIKGSVHFLNCVPLKYDVYIIISFITMFIIESGPFMLKAY